MKTGIYRIRNIINGHTYIGSAKNINRRWQRHRSALIHDRHENIHLQRAWNKYGKDMFIFEILEECLINDLLIIEQKYLDLNPEYNIGKTSSGGDNLTNHPNKIEIIKRMNNTLNDTILNMSDEKRKETYSRPMESNPNWKGGSSYKYCRCGSRISNKATTCIRCRPLNDKDNPFFEKHHTNETKQILSEQHLGKYNGKQNHPIIIDNIEYNSAGEASKILNIPMVTIRWRVISINDKFKNYQYK